MDNDLKIFLKISTVISLVLILGVSGCMYGYPQYNVYAQKMQGEATLAHADFERQVQVRDAQGRLDASKLLAEADIERAKGVAQSNQIIGESLKNNESYIRWLFVQGLETSKNQVIYVPTETQLPILEAGKRAAQ